MKLRLIMIFLILFSCNGNAMKQNAKIYIAGHKGLVGSAIKKCLLNAGYNNIIYRNHHDLDLRDAQAVDRFFKQEEPEYVFLSAAKVGGILANRDYPAEFIYDNLMIATNVIHASYKYEVKKLLFLGSSCIYPRDCPQPIKEEYLLTGPLEWTNEPYALAKITGIKLCESYRRQYGCNFISCMPTNLYGPGDNFDLNNSHVLPALIAKIYTAHMEGQAQVTVWGTGKVSREFLYVDDLAKAALFLMKNYNDPSTINVGTGQDISIGQAAQKISEIIGYKGELVFDTLKPDGTPRKLLDVTKINKLGWQAETSFEDGLKQAIEWYKNNIYKKRKPEVVSQVVA